MILSIKSQKEEAQKYFYRATQFDEQISDKDLHAINVSKKLIFNYLSKQELQLFQARWLFDGGNYQRSLEILEQLKNIDSNEIEMELYYRKARIYHELKNENLALQFYQKVFEVQTSKNLWIKPYSAYYAALIYFEKKNYQQSKNFLHKALEFKNYDFQSSLEQKVKTLLGKIPS